MEREGGARRKRSPWVSGALDNIKLLNMLSPRPKSAFVKREWKSKILTFLKFPFVEREGNPENSGIAGIFLRGT